MKPGKFLNEESKTIAHELDIMVVVAASRKKMNAPHDAANNDPWTNHTHEIKTKASKLEGILPVDAATLHHEDKKGSLTKETAS